MFDWFYLFDFVIIYHATNVKCVNIRCAPQLLTIFINNKTKKHHHCMTKQSCTLTIQTSNARFKNKVINNNLHQLICSLLVNWIFAESLSNDSHNYFIFGNRVIIAASRVIMTVSFELDMSGKNVPYLCLFTVCEWINYSCEP